MRLAVLHPSSQEKDRKKKPFKECFVIGTSFFSTLAAHMIVLADAIFHVLRAQYVSLPRLLMKILNNISLSIEPWGTPLASGVQLDFMPLITTLWAQQFCQFSVHLATHLPSPYQTTILSLMIVVNSVKSPKIEERARILGDRAVWVEQESLMYLHF